MLDQLSEEIDVKETDAMKMWHSCCLFWSACYTISCQQKVLEDRFEE